MFCDYIKIAVSNILTEHEGGIQRCCGSCNPSCDDLTRFICFGHTIAEINEWIEKHPVQLRAEIYQNETKLYAEYADYSLKRDQEDKLKFSKTFCINCDKHAEMRDKALAEHNSVFDAVIEVESFQKDCMKSCIKFNEAYLAHMEELTNEKDFSICV